MEFIRKNKILLILLFLTGVALCFSVGKIANIFLDVGREIYYPLEILKGKVLYKDLFCIYGPFSYLFNALVYKILGAKLTSLYFMGVVSAFSIVTFIYLISKKFLSEFPSVAITLFVIATGCLATRIFNFTLPYSYAVLYGLVCFLVSVYFLISYIENKKSSNLYIASIFGGISICSKYDFILYALPLIFVILNTRDKKLILKGLLGLSLSFLIPFLIIFIQGCRISDLISAMNAIKAFADTVSLRLFYVTQGVYYTNRIWPEWIHYFIMHLIGLLTVSFGIWLFSKKGKLLYLTKTIGVLLVSYILYLYNRDTCVGCYLFLNFLTAVIFILTCRKNTYKENIFILSALLISIKSLWGISHANYGIYYVGVILISFFIPIQKYTNKTVLLSLCLILLAMTSNYFETNRIWIMGMTEKINTDKGRLYTLENWGRVTNEVLSYLNSTEEKDPYVVIFPEGLSVNFLVNKETKAEGFYNSLIPLYTEAFGEDIIIEHYKEKMPDYMIFYNMGMSSYGRGMICGNYAERFCLFVSKNYDLDRTLGTDEAEFKIYKKHH